MVAHHEQHPSGPIPIPTPQCAMVEMVQMLAAPVKDDVEDGVELRQGGVAGDEEWTPAERAHLSQHNTELIDAGRYDGPVHAQSVPRRALHFSMPPPGI